MNKYVIAYINRRGHADWPRSKTIEAKNAKEARKVFDDWYWSRGGDLPHPFHIKVKRYDDLTQCPLCGDSLVAKDGQDAGYVCSRIRCGLKIKRECE